MPVSSAHPTTPPLRDSLLLRPSPRPRRRRRRQPSSPSCLFSSPSMGEASPGAAASATASLEELEPGRSGERDGGPGRARARAQRRARRRPSNMRPWGRKKVDSLCDADEGARSSRQSIAQSVPACCLFIQGSTGHGYHIQGLTCLAITWDSQSIVSGSQDNSVHIVSIKSGQVVGSLVGHTNSVECVGISPRYNNWVAIGSIDQTLIIWDLTHQAIRSICEHDDGVTCLAWIGSSRYVASGCIDASSASKQLQRMARLGI